jgi:radical SAM protein with 4Fe4S-binding SPASM domain
MIYRPVTAVWEITVKCNMHCKHCGSSCIDEAAPDELTTDQALRLAEEMGGLGTRYVTLSGGEPLLRTDWPLLAKALKQNGVTPNMISNGWYFTEETVREARDAGLSNIAISLDGLKEQHDFLRRRGSFDRVMAAFNLMRAEELAASAITTIHKGNLAELPALYRLLEEQGIASWQLQIGSPMGNLAEHRYLILDPAQIKTIVDFAHDKLKGGKVAIHLADCIGYYSHKDSALRAVYAQCDPIGAAWQGCHAGIASYGVRANGDVVGCTSLRDDSFIEGNIRDSGLAAIWNAPQSFSWNRYFDADQLSGFCGRCQYGALCRAGCSVTKLTTLGHLRETHYCLFREEMQTVDRSTPFLSASETVALAREYLDAEEYQAAEVVLYKGLERSPQAAVLWELIGYCYFQLHKYGHCREANEKAIQLRPERAGAYNGLGLTLWKLGFEDEARQRLQQACDREPDNEDFRHDLEVFDLEHVCH